MRLNTNYGFYGFSLASNPVLAILAPVGGRPTNQQIEIVRKEKKGTFVGKIELANTFKAKPKVVVATISFTLVGRTPKFSKIEVDGENLPVRQASESSLLKAYLRRSPCAT